MNGSLEVNKWCVLTYRRFTDTIFTDEDIITSDSLLGMLEKVCSSTVLQQQQKADSHLDAGCTDFPHNIHDGMNAFPRLTGSGGQLHGPLLLILCLWTFFFAAM